MFSKRKNEITCKKHKKRTKKSKASIHGEVICGKLSVEPGADFSASCVMKTNIKSTISNDVQQRPEEKQ